MLPAWLRHESAARHFFCAFTSRRKFFASCEELAAASDNRLFARASVCAGFDRGAGEYRER
jgi:hypothetical protein